MFRKKAGIVDLTNRNEQMTPLHSFSKRNTSKRCALPKTALLPPPPIRFFSSNCFFSILPRFSLPPPVFFPFTPFRQGCWWLLRAMLPHQMLDTLHMQVQQTFACAKTADNDNKLLESIDAVYDLLERLIQWSYDRYTNIELQDGHEEDKEEDTYRIRPQDVVRANQIARNLLVRTVAGKLGDVGEERMETAARLLAHLSGRGGKLLLSPVVL